ncbi:MAG: hypothetical protein FWF10_07245 [Clostridiales bacterium]|nr:hypothetical protein [Clostridiales bacterium]
MRKPILPILILLLLLCACVRQKLVLHYNEPTVSAAPTPLSERRVELPYLTGQPFVQDMNGLPIIDEKTHYFDNYLRFSEIRVYMYGDSVLMDGICTSKFSAPLIGMLRISFYDAEGHRIGTGELTVADDKFRLLPGENNIYATIFAEGDINFADFQFEIVSPILPE